MISRRIRHLIYTLLLFPPINLLGRFVVRILPLKISAHGKWVFPAAGRLKINYGKFGRFIMVSRGADSIASRAYFAGVFANDPATARGLTALFSQAKCFFDVGANTGIYTLMAAKHPNLKQIHSFEPVPRVFHYLRRNIESNEFRHAHAHQLAVSKASGRIKFVVPNGIVLPVGSSEQNSEKAFTDSTFEELDVETCSIDDFLSKPGVLPPDVMKIDTETTEPFVVEGAAKLIDRSRPSIVAEVITAEVGRSLTELFAKRRYKYFLLTEDQIIEKSSIEPDPPLKYLNYALIPEERVTFFKDSLNQN